MIFSIHVRSLGEFLKDFYLILKVEEAVCLGRSKYRVITMLCMTCNYRIKETKLFAVILCQYKLDLASRYLNNPKYRLTVLSNELSKIKEILPETCSSPSSVSFKKVNYAQH